MNDRLRFRIAVFERYNERYNSPNNWVFQKYIEDNNTWHLTTCGDIAHVPCYTAHYRRDNAPDSVNMVYEAQFCTGLKDKNGKLIYEGDIVVFYFDNDEIVGVISWSPEYQVGFYVNTTDYFKDKYVTDYELLYGENYEVIGNIYENTELLEVEQ